MSQLSVFRKCGIIPKGFFFFFFPEEIYIYMCVCVCLYIHTEKFKIEDFCKLDVIYFIISVFQNQALITQKLLSIVSKEDNCRCLLSKGRASPFSPFSPHNSLMRRTTTHLLTNYQLSAPPPAMSRFCQGMRPFNPV